MRRRRTGPTAVRTSTSPPHLRPTWQIRSKVLATALRGPFRVAKRPSLLSGSFRLAVQDEAHALGLALEHYRLLARVRALLVRGFCRRQPTAHRAASIPLG